MTASNRSVQQREVIEAPEESGFLDVRATFAGLGLDRRLFKAVAKKGLVHPSLVQAQTIPLALQGRDLLIRSRTGSGKTLAYVLPLLQTVLQEQAVEGVRAIVLVPTRELSSQVTEKIDSLLDFCRELVSVYNLAGDDGIASQTSHLAQSPMIIVSTPARVIEHLRRKSLQIKKSLRVLAVDEADLVLSYGYDDDMRALLEFLPRHQHQTMLVSATLNPEIDAFKDLVLRNPVTIKLHESDGSDDNRLQQLIVRCSSVHKWVYLYAVMMFGRLEGKSIIFVQNIDTCFRMKLFLEAFSINSAVLNSELPFKCRERIISQFNRGMFPVLVATDAAMNSSKPRSKYPKKAQKEDDKSAGENQHENTDTKDENSKQLDYSVGRGVDFVDVANVINFDFPSSLHSYVHRAGRTSRGGSSGCVISFVDLEPSDKERLVLDETRGYYTFETLNGTQECPIKDLPMQRKDVFNFEYRVGDVSRSVTDASVREARLKELRTEIMNSRKLKAHFEDKPRELELLRHDKVLRPSLQSDHLKEVPSYLLPGKVKIEPGRKRRSSGQRKQPQDMNGRERRKHYRLTHLRAKRKRRTQVDPLKALSRKRQRK